MKRLLPPWSHPHLDTPAFRSAFQLRCKNQTTGTLYIHTLQQDHRVFSNHSGGEEKWGSGEQTLISTVCGTIQRKTEAAGAFSKEPKNAGKRWSWFLSPIANSLPLTHVSFTALSLTPSADIALHVWTHTLMHIQWSNAASKIHLCNQRAVSVFV